VQNVAIELPDGRAGTLVDLFRGGPAFVGLWTDASPNQSGEVISLANRAAPVLRMLDIGRGTLGLSTLGDSTGKLGAALGAVRGKPTFWLLRPDMHLAARIENPDAAKVRRALRAALAGRLQPEFP
jgi:hypothetical protein